ncbi:hypothetical protein L9F63_019060, partial [Diploptera punctata]
NIWYNLLSSKLIPSNNLKLKRHLAIRSVIRDTKCNEFNRNFRNILKVKFCEEIIGVVASCCFPHRITQLGVECNFTEFDIKRFV